MKEINTHYNLRDPRNIPPAKAMLSSKKGVDYSPRGRALTMIKTADAILTALGRDPAVVPKNFENDRSLEKFPGVVVYWCYRVKRSADGLIQDIDNNRGRDVEIIRALDLGHDFGMLCANIGHMHQRTKGPLKKRENAEKIRQSMKQRASKLFPGVELPLTKGQLAGLKQTLAEEGMPMAESTFRRHATTCGLRKARSTKPPH